MDLLNRYLQAVRFWLPKDQQDDIAAELREDLQSRIDEREAGLGCRLTKTEMAVVLQESGRPVLVASRYRPQQSLIGPVLYPIYLFVLKTIALCYLLPWVLVFFSLMTFSQGYRAAHPWGQALLGAWATLWSIGLAIFGATTVTFAILERAQAKTGWMDNWSPLKLPAVRDTRQIKRSNSIAEIVANFVFGLWWVNGWWFDAVMAPHVHLSLAPIWRSLFWAFFLIAIANIVLAAVNLYRPWWTLTRAWVRLALDATGSFCFCWLLKAQVIVAIIAPDISSDQKVALVNAIHVVLARALPFTIAACVVIVAISDLPRLFRLRPGNSASSPQPTPARA